jgi:hypothetical protein
MPTATETEAERVSRSQMWKHEDFVEWATEEGLLSPKATQAQTISVFAANRNAYRRTDRYRSMVDSHRETAAETRAAAQAEAKAAREAKAAEKATAEKAPAKKAAAPAKAAAKKTTSRSKAAASEDNPFDE